MIFFKYFQLTTLILTCLLKTSNCLLQQQVQQQQQQQQQQEHQIGLPSSQIVAPLITREGEDGDSYVVLTDDELLQNADMLRHLSLATKEEVEEIVEGNPAIQTALLNKIKKVLKLKEEANHLLADTKAIKHLNHHNQEESTNSIATNNGDFKSDIKQHVLETEGMIEDYYEDIDELGDQLAAEKIATIKMKLKNNAAKLFKIGSNIRRKIKTLRRKKADEAHRKIPKFHFNVSTSKE